MKKYLYLSLILSLAGCTTTTELRDSAQCKVWKDNAVLGPHSMDVHDSSVTKKGKCLWLFWGCSESKTDLDAEGNIYHKGEGIFSSRTKIAAIQGSEVVYEKTFLDSIINASPVQIDMKQRTARRSVTLNVLNQTSEDTLEFNSACRLPEAAVGAIAFWIQENKH